MRWIPDALRSMVSKPPSANDKRARGVALSLAEGLIDATIDKVITAATAALRHPPSTIKCQIMG